MRSAPFRFRASDGAELHVERWLSDRGMRKIRGPFSLNINDETGCLVDGFDTPPMVMMPHHKAYQGGLIEAAGLGKHKDLYAWRYTTGDAPTRVQKAREDIEAMPEVYSRQVEPKELERDVRLVMDVYNDAWNENWSFVPLTEKELAKLAKGKGLGLGRLLSRDEDEYDDNAPVAPIDNIVERLEPYAQPRSPATPVPDAPPDEQQTSDDAQDSSDLTA